MEQFICASCNGLGYEFVGKIFEWSNNSEKFNVVCPICDGTKGVPVLENVTIDDQARSFLHIVDGHLIAFPLLTTGWEWQLLHDQSFYLNLVHEKDGVKEIVCSDYLSPLFLIDSIINSRANDMVQYVLQKGRGDDYLLSTCNSILPPDGFFAIHGEITLHNSRLVKVLEIFQNKGISEKDWRILSRGTEFSAVVFTKFVTSLQEVKELQASFPMSESIAITTRAD